MTLRSFVRETGPPTYSLAVVSPETDPLQAMLTDAFEAQPIDVENRPDLDLEADTLVALDGDSIVATSPMTDVYADLLAVNSDLYVTGTRGLGDVSLPDALAALSDATFELRGYPLAHKEKFLLITISRCIEQLAWKQGSGTLRTAFQDLSRIEDELGTRDVYTELASTAVDVHCYGLTGTEPAASFPDVQVHTGTSAPYRNGWFVVYRPTAPTPTADAAALVAVETEPRIWEGFWTYSRDRVVRIDEYIAEEL
ncbi:DICT sensory domain-containing protein [Halovivax cerinus]|uniref:DICT sensory domain-containing protein n=1 Tax=Halovivax cerinus TaxID=1487865 RepID=A0ABD5NMS9_9EURY|nr:DICT sensory domain-containing protein [Halovivax cerinus]